MSFWNLETPRLSVTLSLNDWLSSVFLGSYLFFTHSLADPYWVASTLRWTGLSPGPWSFPHSIYSILWRLGKLEPQGNQTSLDLWQIWEVHKVLPSFSFMEIKSPLTKLLFLFHEDAVGKIVSSNQSFWLFSLLIQKECICISAKS